MPSAPASAVARAAMRSTGTTAGRCCMSNRANRFADTSTRRMNGGCFRGMCVLAILVPTYNRAPLLRRALSSLKARVGTTPDVQLIVIDNNSTDDTRAVCAEFRNVRYLFEPIQGLSHARNAGITATAGPVRSEERRVGQEGGARGQLRDDERTEDTQ